MGAGESFARRTWPVVVLRRRGRGGVAGAGVVRLRVQVQVLGPLRGGR